jgi:nucleoid-associated protein YgaU
MSFGIELSFNNYSDSFLIPINPESMEIKEGGQGKTYTVASLGEINVIKSPRLTEISFSSTFPAQRYPFVVVKESERLAPERYLEKINAWRESKRPIRFHAVSSTYVIDMPMSIENFEWKEVAGSPGDIEYQLALKKHVFYAAKKVAIVQAQTIVMAVSSNGSLTEGEQVELQVDEPDRPDERQVPATYTLGPGEGLWVVAKKVLGDGSRYKEIQELNNLTDAQLKGLPVGLELRIPGGEAIA